MTQQTDGTSWPASPEGPDSTRRHPTLPPEGWYPDPSGHAPLRRWTGRAWSEWISDGVGVRWDAEGLRRRLGLADVPHLDFIEHVFLPEARTRGCVTPEEEAVLDDLLLSLRKDAVAGEPDLHAAKRAAGIRPAPPRATPTAPAAPARAWTGPAMPRPTPATPPTLVPPSALSRWWDRTREAVGSDLAVHGLAYVGVLLFFVGAFGLVVFAFGDVAPTLRPVAELVIAAVPFAAAALLLRRGATVVGRALEVMGGLLLPVMVVTSFLDDVALPPDLAGTPLVIALTALMSTIAAAYAVWSRWHPDSALRYLVAPLAWLAVGMATLGLGRPIPDGKGVATPGAAQTASMTVALVATVALARLRPQNRLAGATTAVALPGLAVIACLGVLSWAGEAWPAVPVLVTGLLVLAALELMADRMPPVLVGLLEPLWWALASVGLAQGAAGTVLEGGAVAAVSALGFFVVLEAAGIARRPVLALALPTVGLGSALLATMTDPWWAVASFGTAFVWAAVRRTAPFHVAGAAPLLDLATALLPVVALFELAVATDVPGTLLAGAVVTLVATIPARWGFLRRRPTDRYWTVWWAGATILVGVLTLAALAGATSWQDAERWMLVSAFGLLTVSSTIAPMSPRWRAPVVTALAGLTWVAAAVELDASTLVAVAPLAVTGGAEVVAAHIARLRSSGVAGSLGLTGHVVGTLAVLMAVGPGWAPVVAMALVTTGWWVTGWMDVLGRSPVGASLTRVHVVLGWVPLVLAAAGVPLTVALTLDRADVLALDDPWSVLVPTVTALACAAATRTALPERVTKVAAWTGFLAALVAGAIGQTPATAIVGLASLPGAVVLLRPDRRRGVMMWTAWLAVAPLASVVASEVSTWFASLADEADVAVTLVATGSALLVGASAADLRGRRWTPLTRPAHSWALAPVVVGGAELLLGLLVAASLLLGDVSGWLFATAAVATLLVAVISRAGALTGVAAVLGWWATLLFGLPDLQAAPWVALGTTSVLLLAAQGLSGPSQGARWWARWDLPLLVAAVPVAASALLLAGGGSLASATFALVGAECLVVAARLRRQTAVAAVVATSGTLLVLVGAGIAGKGWLALALLGLAAGLTALAVASSGVTRTTLQLGGAAAAVAAGAVTIDWLGLSAQRSVEAAALLAAAVALVAAGTVLWTPADRSWARVWGATALLVEAVCAWCVLTPPAVRPEVLATWPVAVGLLLVAVALAVSAGRLEARWLGDLSAAFGLAGLMVGLSARSATESTRVVILSLVAAVGAAATIEVSRRAPAIPWRRPVIELGAATALLAVAIAAQALDPMLLVPALLASAVQAAATGVALDTTLLQMASPVLAFGAWLVFSGEALDGNPQWVSVPFGLTILAVVALWRRDRRQSDRPVASPEIVVLELVGIAFLVASAFVQTVTESVAYAALASAIGLAVAAWGVVSRVRRRVAAGVVVVLASMVLLVGVPLVRLLPSWEGAGLWVMMGGLGLLLLVVAATLERSKAAARRGLARFAEVTSGWE